jgi:hypothetical protein
MARGRGRACGQEYRAGGAGFASAGREMPGPRRCERGMRLANCRDGERRDRDNVVFFIVLPLSFSNIYIWKKSIFDNPIIG